MTALQQIGEAALITVPQNDETPQVFVYEDHSDEGTTIILRQSDQRVMLTQAQIQMVADALNHMLGRPYE